MEDKKTIRERLADISAELTEKDKEKFADVVAHIDTAIYKLNKLAEKANQDQPVNYN